jgi:hypothetical protein
MKSSAKIWAEFWHCLTRKGSQKPKRSGRVLVLSDAQKAQKILKINSGRVLALPDTERLKRS